MRGAASHQQERVRPHADLAAGAVEQRRGVVVVRGGGGRSSLFVLVLLLVWIVSVVLIVVVHVAQVADVHESTGQAGRVQERHVLGRHVASMCCCRLDFVVVVIRFLLDGLLSERHGGLHRRDAAALPSTPHLLHHLHPVGQLGRRSARRHRQRQQQQQFSHVRQ